MSTISIDVDAALTAHTAVKAAIDALCAERQVVRSRIAECESRIKTLGAGFLPLSDLKAAILESILSAYASAAREAIKNRVVDFGTEEYHGTQRPLSFSAVSKMLEGDYSSRPTPERVKGFADDLAMYFYCEDSIKSRLAQFLEGMSADDFGYNRVASSHFTVLSRSERRTQMESVQSEVAGLRNDLKVLEEKLAQFGVDINTIGQKQ
ncbi:hypothetical protein [Burkholderia cepacia]|uniref:hypothetical protein n=1 Tax=Burkholderia cepacia TaxID=292 RepID=UPI001CF29301|nr:hypothetical protein [Burkholderia cepacia]MCA8060684.1 hypothetical protein [Burkholderia cepacia]